MRFSDLDFTTIYYKVAVFETTSHHYHIVWYPYSSTGELSKIEKETGVTEHLTYRSRSELDKLLTEIPENELQDHH